MTSSFEDEILVISLPEFEVDGPAVAGSGTIPPGVAESVTARIPVFLVSALEGDMS